MYLKSVDSKSFQNCVLLLGIGNGEISGGCILSSIFVFFQTNCFLTLLKISSPLELLISTNDTPLLSSNSGHAFSIPQ